MKILLGFIALMIALVAICGCTQYMPPAANATTTAATPVPTTVATTVPPTMAVTTLPPATEATTAPATVATTTAVIANITTAVPTPAAASQVTKIHFNSTGFNPAADVVLPGTGVTWVNDDTVPHSVMATGNNTGMFNSGDIVPGGQWTFTFCEGYECRITGTYTYALKDLPAVQGTIIVQAGPTIVGI